ncbi:hypothetical protein GLYMA_02G071850v4 [Glycine max]|nr:hypothetical protein GLYMA_02G071850v4 [Glycine max]KAH1059155.1 hypothetical protein GYH30_003281 [Glycine max]
MGHMLNFLSIWTIFFFLVSHRYSFGDNPIQRRVRH